MPICVASSSAPHKIELGLMLVGLHQRFHRHIFSATMVKRGSPAPDLFLFACAKMGVQPSRCVVIEDSVAGVQAAVAAGMRVVGFSGGSHCYEGHDEKLRAESASVVIDRMDLLARTLSDL